jgi:hypothetical protein
MISVPNFSSEQFATIELLVLVLARFDFWLAFIFSLSLLFSFSDAFCLRFVSLTHPLLSPL